MLAGSLKGFHGFCGFGVVTRPVTRGEYDYLTFEARVSDSYEGPDNYQGVSGGGIWQITIVPPVDGRIEIRECYLSGVVFYQESVPGGIDLSCHGPRSVYEQAIRRLVGASGV